MAPPRKIDPDELRVLWDEDWPIQRIAKHFTVSEDAVHKARRDANLPRKRASRSRALPWPLPEKDRHRAEAVNLRMIDAAIDGETPARLVRALRWALNLEADEQDVRYDEERQKWVVLQADPERWHLKGLLDELVAARPGLLEELGLARDRS